MPTSSEKLDVESFLSGHGKAIPLFKVFMPEEAIEASIEVLRSGYIGQGPRVDTFESKLQGYTSSPYVLSVNSGTSAIHLALRLAGVSYGDEVISTPMTCMATNVPILANGAKIVWADIDPDTGNISPQNVREKITPKTKAILCVDWAGYPCDLDELREIASEHGIKLIEDAAHGFLSEYKGQKIGGLADFTCFSFQAIKHMTTVDGGALICRDEKDYRRGKLLRWYGIDREGDRKDFRCEEDVKEYGYKFHMNDVAAAIGIEQLKFAERIVGAHRANAQYYNEHLSGVSDELSTLNYKNDRVSSYWLYSIRVKDRMTFMHRMKERGITVSQVHARNDLHAVFKAFRDDLPGLEKFSEEQVSIPVGWWLSSEEREYIVDQVIQHFRE